MSALGLAALHAAAAPPLNTHAIGRDSTSTLNSQHSSLEGSPNSQYSLPHTFQESSLRTSQQGGDQGRITPPTSLSNPSSQDELAVESRSARHVAAAAKKGTSGAAVRSDSMRVETRCKEGGSPQIVSAGSQLHAAPKRTADGHMKPSAADHGHHSRTSSTASSRNSQVSELSHQLKTRLSYAMLKVQNGWQDRSIDELETMASQPCSPISAATAPSHRSRRSSHSLLPQRPPTSSSRSIPNGSPKPGTTRVGKLVRSPQLGGGSPTSRPSPRSVALSHRNDIKSPPTSNNASRWEDHPTRHHHRRGELHSTKNGYHPPSLASPVKITTHEPPTSTSHPNPKQPSHSKHNSLGSPFQRSNQPAAQPIHIPATPPPPPSSSTSTSTMKPPPLRTPSQNAAMEADAVETLLFMSSPQNITHPRSARRTPILRSQQSFSPVNDNGRQQYGLSMSPPAGMNRQAGVLTGNDGMDLERERERRKAREARTVDQMIDEVESSSDDELDDDIDER